MTQRCDWFAECGHPAIKQVKVSEVGGEGRTWLVPVCGTHANSAMRWGNPGAGRAAALDAMVEP